MTTVVRANSELVAVAWLGGVAGLSPSMVATTLPKDTSSWASTGFVTVSVVGGSPGMYVARRFPVVQVDCWAVSPSSNKAPWGLAANLAELIAIGSRTGVTERAMTLPANFPAARVMTAYPLSEPRRVYEDGGNYARYQFDLALSWVDLS